MRNEQRIIWDGTVCRRDRRARRHSVDSLLGDNDAAGSDEDDQSECSLADMARTGRPTRAPLTWTEPDRCGGGLCGC
eukprot:272003-Prorocentrum_minimum.AAC.1